MRAETPVSRCLSLESALSRAESPSVRRWFEATEAYYAAAMSAMLGDAAADGVLRYATLSLDPFVFARIAADPNFSSFVNTREYEHLREEVQYLRPVDRNALGG